MKIVINKCWGGFGLSHDGMMAYAKNKGFKLYAFVDKRNADGSLNFKGKNRFKPYDKKEDSFIIYYSKKPLKDGEYEDDSYFSESDIKRDDVELVKTVEKLGEKANGGHANLVVVEIPDGVEYEIDEYDGQETIHEKHRAWG